MSGRRLCEVKEEMHGPLVQLVREAGGPLEIGHQWASLRCPFTNHCDKTGPCRGFTPANRQRISEIEDRLFAAGFVHIEEMKR